ncbi:prepilin-type N-terminal cleavage/methylation domain-containing protein [Pseudoalteromonas sp. MMG006]|uniref:PulJ/GspJ family protein n=1 Tax=Pseudoalteromonas sp. MMG006 TaxID=2822683 RepID=UPI001B398C72|nr:prepilin-type N-terminal cleavage/methylation domain-containing protein [Pseudoalteromonas sp. MMG006]MBQ4799472.1 prepilin-type N-terminal cleavage/methylation domain-containing protein [Pseudoalteromonas sp. MMG006]
MQAAKYQYAFTLIELLLVMVIIGILAVSAFSFIGAGVSIYSQGIERQEAVAQARFVITRISKELRHATPNSLRLSCDNNARGACSVQQCLEFTPFLSATHYTNYLPTLAPFNVSAVDFALNNLTQPQAGDWATIYPLSSADIYDENNNKRLKVSAFNSSASAIDEWQFSKAFAEESPSKRLYLLSQPVSFCVEGQYLYRYTNYGFTVKQLDVVSLQISSGVKRDLLGIYIANNLASDLFFTLDALSLQRNAVLNVNAQMQFNDTEVMSFNHEVHIPNVP